MSRRPREDRHLQAWIDAAKEEDLQHEARWDQEHKIKFDPYAHWYRVGGEGDQLVRPLADGGLVVLLNGPAGWFIVDTKARTFAPSDPLPPEYEGRARRHGRDVYFVDEESARLAAHTLPGYWSS